MLSRPTPILLAYPENRSSLYDPEGQSAVDPLIVLLQQAVAHTSLAIRPLVLSAQADDAACLREFQRTAEDLCPLSPVVIGGFSRGARIAALAAGQLRPRALLCWGYPFHQYGAPHHRNGLRALRELRQPTLILQGSRDPHGNLQTVLGYPALPQNVSLHWLHGCKHRFASDRALEEAKNHAVPFLEKLLVLPLA